MKKALATLMAVVIILGGSLGVFADSVPKDTEIALIAGTEPMNIGETITLSTETLKHGSSYVEQWSGAVWNSTVYDDITGKYVSTATFTAEKPGIYTITYTIVMRSGGSGTEFIATAQKTVEVIGAPVVTGAEARNVVSIPFTRTDGSIMGYSVAANIYILWSDGTATPYSTESYFFGPDETSRVVYVTFYTDGVQYTYPVTITI